MTVRPLAAPSFRSADANHRGLPVMAAARASAACSRERDTAIWIRLAALDAGMRLEVQ
jgi:hypothetical protein